ncbi:MAG TPA: NfeD family protein [Actinomycetota bacterium]|nr:NfeD family protein [Actinomycetota bacterium]
MEVIVGTFLAFKYLEFPWRYVVILLLVAWQAFEIWLYFNLRGKKSITGQEALLGATGRAHTACRPDGQVLVKGQLWSARCPEGLEPGERVVVIAVDGMHLTVRPRDLEPAPAG